MKQQSAITFPQLPNYRTRSVKKVLSMTHGAYRPKVASEFKIRTVRSSQSHRSQPLVKLEANLQPLRIAESEQSDRSVKGALRRPTKPHPRSGQLCRNIPNNGPKPAQQEQTVVPSLQIKLGRKLCSTQLSEVSSAIWETKRRFVAVKQYRPCFSNEQVGRELQRIRDLAHSNLVKYEGYTIQEGRKSAVLELVDGGTLRSFLAQFGPFNQTLIRKYSRQLVEALIYLKGKHLSHGRIRCDNLLSDLNGNIKLTLPRLKQAGADDEHRYLYWTSPEVLRGERPCEKADVWSVGCTLIEMATGRNPWDQQAACLTTFKRQLYSGATPQIPNHLSADCCSFIASCLKKQGADRPSFEQLKESAFLKKL